MSIQKSDEEYIFHERATILKDQGYRGFSVSDMKINEKGEFTVTVRNNSGRILTSSGETKEEAYEKAIDSIDLSLEDPF